MVFQYEQKPPYCTPLPSLRGTRGQSFIATRAFLQASKFS